MKAEKLVCGNQVTVSLTVPWILTPSKARASMHFLAPQYTFPPGLSLPKARATGTWSVGKLIPGQGPARVTVPAPALGRMPHTGSQTMPTSEKSHKRRSPW